MHATKQRLGIDLDGTVAGSIDVYFKRFARKAIAKSIDICLKRFARKEQNDIKGAARNHGLISNMHLLYNETVRKEFSQIWSQWRSIPLVNERIPDYIGTLAKDYDVKIVTATSGSCSDVKNWLESKNFGPIDVVFAQNYMKEAHCDILVDDMAYFVNRMVESGKRGILISRPWSAGPMHDKLDRQVEVFRSWDGIYSALRG